MLKYFNDLWLPQNVLIPQNFMHIMYLKGFTRDPCVHSIISLYHNTILEGEKQLSLLGCLLRHVIHRHAEIHI